MKLNFLFWFYLITGCIIWCSIVSMIFNNLLIVVIGCFIAASKWSTYVSEWYLQKIGEIDNDNDIDFRDL